MSVEEPRGARTPSDALSGWLFYEMGAIAYRKGTSPPILCRVCGAQMVWRGGGVMLCTRADGGSCDLADPADALLPGDPRA